MEKLAYYWKRLRKNLLAYNLVLIGAIILAMAVAAHIVMQVGTRHGARRTVPDFSGVKLDQAQRMARKYDLKLHINDSLFVPAYEGGIVLDQLPEGGVEVKPGRTVYITINSFRQKMVPVPYVAGRSLRQAKNMLEIAGLEIDELVYRADMATNYVLEEYCEGKPVTPTTRMEAEMGSGVTLYVGVEEGYGTTIVPRLVGLPLAQALLIVQGADILTGLLCAVTGKSRKTESGKVSSGALLMGVMKKGLEWLVVGVCVSVGNGLGVASVCGAAMTYMIATELVSLIENLEIFGLNVPLLGKLLDVAQGDGEEGRAQGRQ